MRKFLLAIPFALIAAQASAACSKPEDFQAKAMEMSTVAQQLAQKNPTAYQAFAQKTMQAAQDMQTKGIQVNDYEKACAFYDDLINEAKKGM